ncbi:hypothetical protein ACFQH6_04495 [Halobacteriaceae archaeon GCM10025711]
MDGSFEGLGFRSPRTRVGRVFAVLVAVAAVLVVMPLLDISYGVFRAVSPAWVGVLVFGYLGLRFVRAVERIADGRE